MKVSPADKPTQRSVDMIFSGGRDQAEGAIPWTTAAAWRECRLSLKRTIAATAADLDAAVAIAGRIVHRYDLAGDLFDELAGIACAVCRRPCCRDARVWLDFKDLLLIHLGGQPLPPGQLRRDWWEGCRYLTSHGCTLPRAVRPWVCTWYICPDQRRVLARDIPGGPVLVGKWWREISVLRNQLEDTFLKALRPSWRPTSGLLRATR
jgi:hypothetical protein